MEVLQTVASSEWSLIECWSWYINFSWPLDLKQNPQFFWWNASYFIFSVYHVAESAITTETINRISIRIAESVVLNVIENKSIIGKKEKKVALSSKRNLDFFS